MKLLLLLASLASAEVITVPADVLYPKILTREFSTAGVTAQGQSYLVDDAKADAAVVAAARAHHESVVLDDGIAITQANPKALLKKWRDGKISDLEKDRLLMLLAAKIFGGK